MNTEQMIISQLFNEIFKTRQIPPDIYVDVHFLEIFNGENCMKKKVTIR